MSYIFCATLIVDYTIKSNIFRIKVAKKLERKQKTKRKFKTFSITQRIKNGENY